MIDPANVRNFQRTDYELEEFAFFCVCVAGKRADDTAIKLEKFLLAHAVKNMTPTQAVQMLSRANALEEVLRIYKFGQYKRISLALQLLVTTNLRTADLSHLQWVMGPKSARFFLMNTRPNQRLAALDTHILAELREIFPHYTDLIPKSTPPYGGKYLWLENLWLQHCDSQGVDPSEYDLTVWTRRSKILERSR